MKNCFFPRILLRHASVLCALGIICVLLVLGIFAHVFAPNNPYAVDLPNKLLNPCGQFPLGTDQLGRCILSRLIFGIRTSLATAFITTVLIMLIGIPLGVIAGYTGGIVDALIMRCTDIASTFPSSLLALAVVGVFGPSLTNLIIVFLLLWWAPFARIVRGTVKKLKESDFVLAAISVGDTRFAVITRHILVNAMPPVIVLGTLRIAAVIIHIAAFSFIGLGSQPPAADWGVMLNDARQYISSRPLLLVWPGLAIMISVLAFNMLGEGMNEILTPAPETIRVKEEAADAKEPA